MFDKVERIARPDLSNLSRLRFLTTTDFPPFNFTDQTGRLSGFHIDLVRALCDELNMTAKCQVQALPYADLQQALSAGEGEAVIAGIAASAELRETFNFTRPFMMLPARFAIRKDAGLSGSGIAGLFGRPVGVVAKTRHAQMLKAFFPDVRAEPFQTRTERDEALQAGKVDAVFGDGLQLSFWVHSEAAKTCCEMFAGPYFSEHFLGEGLTIMTAKTNPNLTGALNSALATLSRNGQMQDIYERYFPYDLYGEVEPAEAADGSGQPVTGNRASLKGSAGQAVEPKPVTQ